MKIEKWSQKLTCINAKHAFIHKLTTICNFQTVFFSSAQLSQTHKHRRVVYHWQLRIHLCCLKIALMKVSQWIGCDTIFLTSDSACGGSIFQVSETGEEICVLLDKFVCERCINIFGPLSQRERLSFKCSQAKIVFIFNLSVHYWTDSICHFCFCKIVC